MRRANESTRLVGSPERLRSLVTLFTLGTFAGASAFAAGHLYNPAAPLQPPVAGAIAPATGTGPGTSGDDDGEDDDRRAAPTATPATRSRTTITPNIGTTTRGARTRTRQS